MRGEREADPEILDPEVVIHSAMTHATYHGYEGLRRWMAEIDHQFDDWNVLIGEFRDASGRLLALGTVRVRGRTSGVAFDQPMALLLAFAEGRLIELRTIPDHAQALEAAGLSEQAMSQENVESFKRGVEAANRRDLEAALEEFDPEVEWHPGLLMSLEGEATVYRGHEGIRVLYGDFDELFDKVHWEYAEIRDLGDQVVGIGRFRMRGKGSGAETESPICSVVDFKNGKAIQVRTYLDPNAVLEAAGLPEQTMSQRTSRWFGAASGALTPSGDAVEDVV